MLYFYVVLAGGLGALIRFLLAKIPHRSSFWDAIMTANMLGCLLLGFFTIVMKNALISEAVFLIISVGFCSALTTFSSLMLQFSDFSLRKMLVRAIVITIFGIAFFAMGTILAKNTLGF